MIAGVRCAERPPGFRESAGQFTSHRTNGFHVENGRRIDFDTLAKSIERGARYFWSRNKRERPVEVTLTKAA